MAMIETYGFRLAYLYSAEAMAMVVPDVSTWMVAHCVCAPKALVSWPYVKRCAQLPDR
jgi:hypothetical protein